MCESHVIIDGQYVDPNDFAVEDSKASAKLAELVIEKTTPNGPKAGQFIVEQVVRGE